MVRGGSQGDIRHIADAIGRHTRTGLPRRLAEEDTFTASSRVYPASLGSVTFHTFSGMWPVAAPPLPPHDRADDDPLVEIRSLQPQCFRNGSGETYSQSFCRFITVNDRSLTAAR